MYKYKETEQRQLSFFQFNASCGMQLDNQNKKDIEYQSDALEGMGIIVPTSLEPSNLHLWMQKRNLQQPLDVFWIMVSGTRFSEKGVVEQTLYKSIWSILKSRLLIGWIDSELSGYLAYCYSIFSSFFLQLPTLRAYTHLSAYCTLYCSILPNK